jgi:hypothetical protein
MTLPLSLVNHLLQFLVLFVPFLAFAAESPQFSDFPIASVYIGRHALPDLSTSLARQFRTRLTDAARMAPNFAGQYIVVTWGCGTGCGMGAIVNAGTGKVVFLPTTMVIPEDSHDSVESVQFRLESRLIIFTAHINNAQDVKDQIEIMPGIGPHFYIFDGSRLVRLKTLARPER